MADIQVKLLQQVHCVKIVQIQSLFCSVFSCVRSEYRDLQSKSLYSVRIQENTDQKKLGIWTLFTRWLLTQTLRKKCPYSELVWSAFLPHFLHSDWIGRDTLYLSEFSRNAQKCGQIQTRIFKEYQDWTALLYNENSSTF